MRDYKDRMEEMEKELRATKEGRNAKAMTAAHL